MPGIVSFAVWLTFLNTGVLFEEIVVDRQGVWRYMPYYRVGKFCPWDLGRLSGPVTDRMLPPWSPDPVISVSAHPARQ